MSDSTALALDRQREAASVALLERPAFDIAAMSDAQFEEALALHKKRQERVQKVLLNLLERGLDYGTVPGVEGDFPWEGAADKVARFLRWNVKLMNDRSVEITNDALLVTLELGIFDQQGQLLATCLRGCSSKEKRFRKRNGGWRFDDHREVLNECVSMAAKRAKVAGVLSAAGIKGVFKSLEARDASDEGAEPWTKEEQRWVKEAAKKAGMKTRDEIRQLAIDVLGRDFVGTGEDVRTLLEAIEAKGKGETPARVENAAKGAGRPTTPLKDTGPDPYASGKPEVNELSELPKALQEDDDDELPFS